MVGACWEGSGSIEDSIWKLDEIMLSCNCDRWSYPYGCDNENENCVNARNGINRKLKKREKLVTIWGEAPEV